MATRTYGDRCGIARALDVVGDRWALLIVRELLFGPKRFTDLRDGLTHIGPDVLAQRLKELEASDVLRRRTLDPPAASRVYELTDRGAALEPLVLELGRWGSGEGFTQDQSPLGPDSFVLALKTLVEPGSAEGLDGVIRLRVGEATFEARAEAGEVRFTRGESADPAASIEGSAQDLARLLWHAGGSNAVLDSPRVAVSGDRRVAKRFLDLFPPPRRAAA